MNQQGTTGTGISGSGFAALIVLVAGTLYLGTLPLETTRPAVKDLPRQQRAHQQGIDARLWQDPFSALNIGIEASSLAPTDPASQAEVIDKSARSVFEKEALEASTGASGANSRNIEVLAIMVPGGQYAEDIESRRRTRYAVLSALNASSFEPFDGEHIDYFVTSEVNTEVKDAELLDLVPGARLQDRTPRAKLPVRVPYEWFVRAADARLHHDNTDHQRVLVLWLNADAFGQLDPFGSWKRLSRLVPGGEAMTWRVLGPAGSEGLKAMVDAANGKTLDMPNFRFYSPAASVSTDVLLRQANVRGASTTLEQYFQDKKLWFIRTITDDRDIAAALIDELSLRGVRAAKIDLPSGYTDREGRAEMCRHWSQSSGDQPSHIAIVSEWDTMYGRSMRRTFRASSDHPAFCVERFSYMRGLDGQLPTRTSQSDEAKEAKNKTTEQSSLLDALRNRGTHVERAEGQIQYDYLRRLAQQMRERDAVLRRSRPDGMGLRAIGVLGNDVHDKLLVLKALQPEFPDAIFFTSDMDQRLAHPREQAATRNLIVASGFGLRLADGLQEGTPAFRDSDQTSYYFAARLALLDAQDAPVSKPDADAPTERGPGMSFSGPAKDRIEQLERWVTKPRIFEIGRTRVFDFSETQFDSSHQRTEVEHCRGANWKHCRDIHPPGSRMFPMLETKTLFTLCSLLMLALWLPPLIISRSVRRNACKWLRHRPGLPQPTVRWVAVVCLLAVLHFVLPALMTWSWPWAADSITHKGKPLVAFEGLSLWPTELVRLFTLALCGCFVWRAWISLGSNLDDIAREFRVRSDRRTFNRLLSGARLGTWGWLQRVFSINPMPFETARCGMNQKAVTFWLGFAFQNKIRARAARTAALVGLAVLAGLMLAAILNETSMVPQRGSLSLRVHQVLTVLVHLAAAVLVAFVVDATAFCILFVRGLRLQRANWPENALRHFERELSVPRGDHLDNWLDLRFVALRTRAVGHLIYYPFIALSLLLLSRSAMFDDWRPPTWGLSMAAASALITLSCGIALRVMAERSRSHAIRALQDDLIRLSAKPARVAARGRGLAPERPSPRQLELLLERVQALRDGAFAPYSQQPLLKAALLPFATLGGSGLVELMLLTNF